MGKIRPHGRGDFFPKKLKRSVSMEKGFMLLGWRKGLEI
jgi:hypothetical protein